MSAIATTLWVSLRSSVLLAESGSDFLPAVILSGAPCGRRWDGARSKDPVVLPAISSWGQRWRGALSEGGAARCAVAIPHVLPRGPSTALRLRFAQDDTLRERVVICVDAKEQLSARKPCSKRIFRDSDPPAKPHVSLIPRSYASATAGRESGIGRVARRHRCVSFKENGHGHAAKVMLRMRWNFGGGSSDGESPAKWLAALIWRRWAWGDGVNHDAGNGREVGVNSPSCDRGFSGA